MPKKSKCIVETFSRVTGFMRPVQTWNKGKVQEFKDRKEFKVDDYAEKTSNSSLGRCS